MRDFTYRLFLAALFIVGVFVGIGLTLAWQGNVTVEVPVPTNPNLGQLVTK